ncbi:hypothetical protein ACFL14_01555 [Patescibacteria group bacterium]
MINIGRWAFIIGVLLAILAGFFNIPNLAIVMAILGLIVGFLNIEKSEIQIFLISVTALLVIGISSLSALDIFGFEISGWLITVIGNFITFVASAGVIVALQAVYQSIKPGK